MLAAAKTSGLTPWRIWAASSSEPAKLSRTSVSSASPKSGAHASSASVIDAAAETMSRCCWPPLAGALEPPSSSSSPQPTATRAASTSARARTRFIRSPFSTMTEVALTAAVAARPARGRAPLRRRA